MKIGQHTRQLMTEGYKDKIKDCQFLFFANFKGLTADGMKDIRSRLRKSSSDMIVVKNNLFKQALEELKMEKLSPYVDIETAVIYGVDDPVLTSKFLEDLRKEKEEFKIKIGYIEEKILSAEEVKSLASIPPREVLYSQVVSLIKSPINNIVFVLKGSLRSLVNVIKQIKDKKENNPNN
ncbi:MAG: 50S ribosomal protein L10 [Candidatus Omnitrophica bacterium]|nr:50S ribosomal protein L10 [Candidatus Omnitrophota bacterium]